MPAPGHLFTSRYISDGDTASRRPPAGKQGGAGTPLGHTAGAALHGWPSLGRSTCLYFPIALDQIDFAILTYYQLCKEKVCSFLKKLLQYKI